MEKELTPNQQKKINKGQNKIEAAVLQKQNLQKEDKPVPQSLRDKIDMSYNKLANLMHKYKFGKKSEYDGVHPSKLAKHQGYVGESIFESLENLNVSAECFEDIVGLVESTLLERKYSEKEIKDLAVKVRPARAEQFRKAMDQFYKATKNGEVNPDNFSPIQTYRANLADKKLQRAQDRLNHVDDIIDPPINTPTGIKRGSKSK